MSKEVVNLAEKLIRFKTISRHYKEIKECAAFIERYATANRLYYEFHDNGNNPVIREYQQIVEDVIDKKVNFLRDGRMSNSGMLKDKKGASVILHSYDGGGYHAEDEWVDLKSVEQLYTIQKKFVENYSNKC